MMGGIVDPLFIGATEISRRPCVGLRNAAPARSIEGSLREKLALSSRPSSYRKGGGEGLANANHLCHETDSALVIHRSQQLRQEMMTRPAAVVETAAAAAIVVDVLGCSR